MMIRRKIITLWRSIVEEDALWRHGGLLGTEASSEMYIDDIYQSLPTRTIGVEGLPVSLAAMTRSVYIPAQEHAMEPFWRRKTLAEMTQGEWESLCDGCGRCCLNKLEEGDSGRIYYTDVGCRLLDARGCRCRDYANRSAEV